MAYTEQDLAVPAGRENNKKRKYLIVNPLQGKHVPVSPGRTFQMFADLADLLQKEYEGETLLLIGFAETATAVGAAVAGRMGTLYMQTTREQMEGVEYFYFSEEHSHATEQKLVKTDLDQAVSRVDRIIFIEDEITTGKTIRNIIRLLEQAYPGSLSYSAAALLNGMDEECLKVYRESGIRLHWLVKICHDGYEDRVSGYQKAGVYHTCDLGRPVSEVPEYAVFGYQNARRLTDGAGYQKACERMAEDVLKNLSLPSDSRMLVIGTEEFMYPALWLAYVLEKEGRQVRCHSTTRSPIAVSNDRNCPLHERYELRSFYDSSRKTFLYDIAEYDGVLIVTDAENGEKEGMHTLVNALHLCKNENIYVIRWCTK